MRLNYQMGVILDASKNSDTPFGVHEVMQYLDISKSAAYLLIQNCRIWLIENRLEEDSSQQRRELYIKKGELKKRLKERLSKASYEEFDFSPRERRIYLIVLLIRERHLSTHSIMERFRISRNTCILDLAEVNRILRDFQLGYMAGNHGYALVGEEYNVHRLSLWVVSKIFLEFYPKNYEMAMSLYEFSRNDVEAVRRMFTVTAESFHLFISREAVYTFGAVCTLISRRIRQGHTISLNMIPDYYRMSIYNCRIRSILYQSGIVNTVLGGKEHSYDKVPYLDSGRHGMAESLARMLVCVCGESGTDLISIPVKRENLNFYARQIIEKFETYIGIFFEDKEELEKAVTLSLKCILLRRRYGFKVFNPLIQEVEKHYIHIIRLTKKSVEDVGGVLGTFTEEDCVLFSLNFLGGMYKTKRIAGRPPYVLVVYAGNSHTAVLLQGQIQNLLPGARVLTASLFHDLIRFSEYADMIVSAIPIEFHEIPVVVVNTFLTDHEKERIKKLAEHKISKDEDLLRFLEDFSAMSEEFMNIGDQIYLRSKMEEYFRINRVKINYGAGKSQMLKDLLTENRIRIKDSVNNWKEAIRLAAKPLEEEKSIEPSYTDAMIESIEKLGPYILLAPGIALPSARSQAGVRTASMSLLKVREKVYFTKEKYANLFFVLASADGNSHLEVLRDLSVIFADEGAYGRFMGADTAKELHQLFL